MVRKNDPAPTTDKPALTVERAARLYQMLNLLGAGPQTRGTLARRLKLDVRGFYRDLELLRAVGIIVQADSRFYRLLGSVNEAVNLLPLPDPRLTLGEATRLAKGPGAVQKKLREHLNRIVNPRARSRSG